MASVWAELKRRSVVKVALAYAAAAWLVLQLADVLIPLLQLPDWAGRLVLLLLLAGFPIAMFFAWAYEMTPEGLKREADVDPSRSTTARTGRKLDFVIIAVLGIALVYFVSQRFLGPEQSASSPPEVTDKSVAVLPFADMSPNKDQEYFSDGIAEELLNQLTRLHGLHVAGRTSSFSFKGANEDLRVIGEKLNVAHIIEGSVRKAGDRVRITVQLVKATDGYHLWSQTYDRQLNDIFAIEEETAKSVADALSITLGVGDVDFAAGGTRNFEAYDARLEAQSLMLQQGSENAARAIQLLEKAVALDPDYADAWSLLSTAYGAAGAFWISERAEEYLDKSARAARRAIEIAPDAVQSLRISAGLRDGNHGWVDGERSLQKALALAPADLINLLFYGNFLLTVGRSEEAIEYEARAVETDPLALTPSLALALAYQTNGDSEQALAEFERARGLIGNHVLLNGALVVFAMEKGDRDLIDKYLDTIERDPASPPVGRDFSRTMQELFDSPEAARQELHRSYRDPVFNTPVSRGVIAVYAAYFGDPELALKIFDELNQENVLPGDSIWRPIYKEVRHLPGFKDLMRERGLVDYWRTTGNWGKFCRPTGPDDFECE